jgi:hypothetical protein
LLSFLPITIITAIFAWPNYILARKSGRSGILYAVLTLIPIAGFIPTWYLINTSLYRALDQKSANT